MNQAPSFQTRVGAWMIQCFSMTITNSLLERGFRFGEESLELQQTIGVTREQAHALVDYVYGRPTGERPQEVGGVMVTLAALCHAAELSMDVCGEIELARVNTPEMIDKIRRKHNDKVLRIPESALPGQPKPADDIDHVRLFWANIFKPLWLAKAWLMINAHHRLTGYLRTMHYARGLWDIALDDVKSGLPLMSPADALSVDAQYWED